MIEKNYRIAKQFNNEPVIYQGKYSKLEINRRAELESEWLAECNGGSYAKGYDNVFYVLYIDHETLKGNQIKVWAEKIND